MQGAETLPLAAWANYYVIIGSAAAALTGLMFVVITLSAGIRNDRLSDGVSAFSTPTVVHFGAALFIAGLLSAPWPALWWVSVLLGLAGIGGIIYAIIVLRRVRRQSTYQPVMEDWLWHTLFPLASYAALVVAAILLPAAPTLPLFLIAAATLLLLFIGIHNAWDTVTYLVVERLVEDKGRD